MKHLLPIIMIAYTAIAFGQSPTSTPEKTQSKLEQFSSRSGSLLERRFETVGKVKNVTIQVYTVTDLVAGTKAQGVRFEYYAFASYGGDTKIGVLDADEVDGLVKSIRLLKSDIFPSTKDVYTEINYYSRSGFGAGAYFSDQKWTAYLKLEKFDSKSQVVMKPEDFDQLLTVLETAKEKMK